MNIKDLEAQNKALKERLDKLEDAVNKLGHGFVGIAQTHEQRLKLLENRKGFRFWQK